MAELTSDEREEIESQDTGDAEDVAEVEEVGYGEC